MEKENEIDAGDDIEGTPAPETENRVEPTMPPASSPQGPSQAPPQGPPQGQYPPPPPPYPPYRRQSTISNKPRVVGALLAIVAVLGLITAAMGFVGFAVMDDFSDWAPGDGDEFATIMGQATYPNGDGIEGVMISVEGMSSVTFTDVDGYYILYNVPTGDRVFTASKENLTTLELRVTIYEDFNFRGTRWDGEERYGQYVDFVMHEGTGVEKIGKFDPTDEFFHMGSAWLLTCTAIILVASLLALMGAIHAFRRRSLMMVIVGAVAGIFTIGFLIGSVLAFVALFVLLLGMDEFRGAKKDESPA